MMGPQSVDSHMGVMRFKAFGLPMPAYGTFEITSRLLRLPSSPGRSVLPKCDCLLGKRAMRYCWSR